MNNIVNDQLNSTSPSALSFPSDVYMFLWRYRGQRSQLCACVDASERRISRKSVRSEVKASSSSELSRPPPIRSEGRVGLASPESGLSLALRPHIWRASADRLLSALSVLECAKSDYETETFTDRKTTERLKRLKRLRAAVFSSRLDAQLETACFTPLLVYNCYY